MNTVNFYSPEAVRPLYDEIALAYQEAFAGEPWYEVSKCPDQLQRCTGGLSSVALGNSCETCGGCPMRPAYQLDDLVSKFEELADTRPTSWYAEQVAGGVALAAVAWAAEPSVIAEEKYGDVPAMRGWLQDAVGASDIAWLDEVFANRALRSAGNLRNFGQMCRGFIELLGTDALAFRTINERMVAATKRDFKGRSLVFRRTAAVPDRRDFVVIKRSI